MLVDKNVVSVNTNHSDVAKKGDINLIGCVRDILIHSGRRDRIEQLFDTNTSIIYALDKGPKAQRDVLIAFWNLQFMGTACGGHEERACLSLPFNDEDWLRVFNDKLVPFILDNDLPKALYGWEPKSS